jgi:hypothetical protein
MITKQASPRVGCVNAVNIDEIQQELEGAAEDAGIFTSLRVQHGKAHLSPPLTGSGVAGRGLDALDDSYDRTNKLLAAVPCNYLPAA